MCEASAAVPFPSDSFGVRMAVANDGDNLIRVYDVGHDRGPVATCDLDPYLGLRSAIDGEQKADLEGATWLDGKASGSGPTAVAEKAICPSRRQLFSAVMVQGPDGAVTITQGSLKSFTKLLDALMTIRGGRQPATQPDEAKAPEPQPEKLGLNIEGLAARPDGGPLLIGLRNPLTPDGQALIVPLENPAEVVERGADPTLGRPILLDLGGRGIRDLAYAPHEQAFYIIAGPATTVRLAEFDLYRCTMRPIQR